MSREEPTLNTVEGTWKKKSVDVLVWLDVACSQGHQSSRCLRSQEGGEMVSNSERFFSSSLVFFPLELNEVPLLQEGQ